MTVLLLAGTGEARQIAWGLADSGIDIVASLAGATRSPMTLPVPTRVGGFGGEDGFRAYLKDARITSVLDATHPFAARITNRTARVCADLGLPHAVLVRPGRDQQVRRRRQVRPHVRPRPDHRLDPRRRNDPGPVLRPRRPDQPGE